MKQQRHSTRSAEASETAHGINRLRRLLLVGGLTTGTFAFLGGASWLSRSGADLIASVIRRHLPDTELSDELIQTFATDFLIFNREIRKHHAAFHALRVVGPLAFSQVSGALLSTKQARLLAEFEREVVTRFLFSTDFFERGAKDWKEVTYQGFYDPYLRPCSNPLVGLD